MEKHIARTAVLAAAAAIACLALAGCDTGDLGQGSTNKLGLAIGLAIIAASWFAMRFQGRHFARKRQANKRKNSKKRKR